MKSEAYLFSGEEKSMEYVSDVLRKEGTGVIVRLSSVLQVQDE